MNNGTVVKLIDVHKTYRSGEVEVQAVRGVSLEIQRGEFVALMGASGSGKSTLMNLLGCLDRPTRGQYLLDNTDVSHLIAISWPISATVNSGLFSKALISCRVLPRAKTSSFRCSTDGISSAISNRVSGLTASLLQSVCKAARNIIPVSFPADSSSASPLRGRSLMTPRSCSQMSRPATSTAEPALKSWESFRS